MNTTSASRGASTAAAIRWSTADQPQRELREDETSPTSAPPHTLARRPAEKGIGIRPAGRPPTDHSAPTPLCRVNDPRTPPPGAPTACMHAREGAFPLTVDPILLTPAFGGGCQALS